MPVPVYLAANCKEIATFTGRAAVLGLGFLPDGGARIPACPLQGHMAVIDDAVLPQRVPEETLDRLAARCCGGCCLDFLRTPGPVHRAVAQGLQRRLGNAPMLLPAAYHAFAPEALPVLSCLRSGRSWRTQRHMAAAAPSVCGRSCSRFSRSGMDKTVMRLRAAFPCAA